MKRLKVSMLGLMVLMLLISPLSISANSLPKEELDNTLEYETLEGGEKLQYLRALEKSNLYDNNVSNRNLDRQASLVADLGQHEYADEDIIMINSVVKQGNGEEVDMVYAFIGKDSKEVLKLSHFNIGEEVTNYKDYSENGTLMLHYEFATSDFKEGNLDNKITHYSFDQGISIQEVDRDSFWFKFACGFSGLVSCNLGCLVSFAAGPAGGGALFTICSSMCQLVWGAGLC